MKKRGFSLAEMMIVMLAITIVLAASAPMITRKVTKERSDKIFDVLSTDPNNAVDYIKGRDQIIFMNAKNNGYVGIREAGETIPKNSVLFGYIKTPEEGLGQGVVGIGFNVTPAQYSVAIGTSVTGAPQTTVLGSGAGGNGTGAVAIGYHALAKEQYSVAIGQAANSKENSVTIGFNASANGNYSIAQGYNSRVEKDNSIAIGYGAKNGNTDSIAIGYNATTKDATETHDNSTAIGSNASAAYSHSTAIGADAKTEYPNTIVLGTEADTVYIPGNLIVGKATAVGVKGVSDNGNYPLYIYSHSNHNNDGRQFTDLVTLVENNFADDYKGTTDWAVAIINNSIPGVQLGHYQFKTIISGDQSDDAKICPPADKNGNWHRPGSGSCGKIDTSSSNTYLYSDLRLKDVGAPFVGGLDEINKMNVYNFTFKADKNKTPQVGVIAQDLQKIFPNAVITGEDGYLKIRWDEILYSAINAIKELDKKIITIAEKIQNNTNEILKLKETVNSQQAIIDAQAKQLEILSSKVEKLEAHKK
jgi:prepilin-type N-terminal cleavage/methylation domain-containing protein